MARVEIYSDYICNFAASHHIETNNTIDHHMFRIKEEAEILLGDARATTEHVKFNKKRAHKTEIKARRSDVDGLVWMEGDNAIAIEFGHRPSGRFEDIPSKPPTGLYIITRAALGG